MTEEEYVRMKNILNTVIEQQALFAENHLKAEKRMDRSEDRMNSNAEAIAALLTIAEVHEQERVASDERVNAKFAEVAERFAQTDERMNALVNVVERYITRG